ncbi:MAG: hypothetical protein JKY54_15735 [Flavobacteriales bacterium]|nr:hypothetical protein [Flavobacteriales bacterium]
MITVLYITHLTLSAIIIITMIRMFIRSNQHQEKGIKNSLVLVYSLVLIAGSLFVLRYYQPTENANEYVLALSQVLSYFLFFGAVWHLLMAMVASGIDGITTKTQETNSADKDYDPDGKSIINI